MSYAFRFGRCTNPTFGAVALDMIDLPHVQMNFAASDVNVGSSTRALDGTKRMDRYGLKREWPALQVGVYRSVAVWAPVKRMWKAGGPWLFYDHTTENLLGGDARLMQNGSWSDIDTNAVFVPRLDGTIANLGINHTASQGPGTSPPRSVLTPVTAGQLYSAYVTVNGPAGWSVATVNVAWYDAVSAAPISVSTVAGGVSLATAASTTLILDGSVYGGRVGGSATAPAGAVYAQIRVTNSANSAIDVSDPNFIPGPSDPGNAMTVVLINKLDEQHNTATIAGLTMDLSEV